MAIRVDLDILLVQRKMTVKQLSERVDISPTNLSVLKNGRARAIRFSTLAALCQALECEPGDILRFDPEPPTN
ncbi:transcriptional regulator [Dermabacter sp. HMSC06F07]|uniref:helix-turn-helix domain-containing protein n=1 Tax=Dermabacter sp. HMSC06F07 TaxID=1581125 RepID=UPI0008A2130D|nr:helix-turn-helix transcriptional regulator [Dermabacter sp. HMSC06F07]MDU5962069.1 helix-turn-helix transcriptional regulator [Dermabacter sp.]OFT45490.1 transcriptional regulator [Dermabacter sp. HMSC06F07]